VTLRGTSRWVVPAAALTLLVTLAGCGKLDPHPGTGSLSSTPAGSAATSTPAADDSGADSATLDGITQDLDAADAANTEAGSNAGAADQAGATGDEP
jgi:hypothetical protein